MQQGWGAGCGWTATEQWAISFHFLIQNTMDSQIRKSWITRLINVQAKISLIMLLHCWIHRKEIRALFTQVPKQRVSKSRGECKPINLQVNKMVHMFKQQPFERCLSHEFWWNISYWRIFFCVFRGMPVWTCHVENSVVCNTTYSVLQQRDGMQKRNKV